MIAPGGFTELVQQKIEERREGRSAAAQAAAVADERFKAVTAPLVAAVSEMLARLTQDPMFANAMGRPEVMARRDDTRGQEGQLRFEGRSGLVSFNVQKKGVIGVRIYIPRRWSA